MYGVSSTSRELVVFAGGFPKPKRLTRLQVPRKFPHGSDHRASPSQRRSPCALHHSQPPDTVLELADFIIDRRRGIGAGHHCFVAYILCVRLSVVTGCRQACGRRDGEELCRQHVGNYVDFRLPDLKWVRWR